MTSKTFRQIIDFNDVNLLRERKFEISKDGWHDISLQMTFSLGEAREFKDYINWELYAKRMNWKEMVKHLEFKDKSLDLNNVAESYKRNKKMSAIHVVGEEVYVYDDFNRKIIKATITEIIRDEFGKPKFNLITIKDKIKIKDVDISIIFSNFDDCLKDALKYISDNIIENSMEIDE